MNEKEIKGQREQAEHISLLFFVSFVRFILFSFVSAFARLKSLRYWKFIAKAQKQNQMYPDCSVQGRENEESGSISQSKAENLFA